MGQLFKNKIFGGFKKAEVIEYINKQKKDYEEQAESMRSSIALLEKNAKAAQEDFSDKDDKILELEEQNAQILEKLAASEILAQALRADAEQAVLKAEETAAQYSELKEYIADIELSAYKRAREVQNEASMLAAQVTQDIIAVRDNVSPVAQEAHAQVRQAEEAFGGFKTKIAKITHEIDELVEAINSIEKAQTSAQPVQSSQNQDNTPLKTLQDILNRVKRSGQFK